MSKVFNLSRYIVSILLPILCCFDPYYLFWCSFLLLAVNNIIDDFVFYLANIEINPKRYKGGMLCPVNGIVTKIENDVELFNDIVKQDALTKEKIFDVANIKAGDNEKYNHLTIFLNKFSHHIAINPYDCTNISQHFRDGELKEMVLKNNLVVEKTGEYILNDCVIFEYSHCIYVVLTMDKYISKYFLFGRDIFEPSCIICRGSQCDIYIPNNYEFCCTEGDCLNAYDTIVKGMFNAPIVPIKEILKNGIVKAIKSDGGAIKIIANNISKSFDTFKKYKIATIMIVSCLCSVLMYNLMYVGVIVFYLFVFVRFYKHLMYSLMNIIGNKDWMQKSYKIINKISLIWEKN